MDDYYSYRHKNNLFCPFRYFALIGSIIIFMFLINMKFAYIYPLIANFEWFLFYNGSAFLLVKAFFASFLLYVLAFEEVTRY